MVLKDTQSISSKRQESHRPYAGWRRVPNLCQSRRSSRWRQGLSTVSWGTEPQQKEAKHSVMCTNELKKIGSLEAWNDGRGSWEISLEMDFWAVRKTACVLAAQPEGGATEGWPMWSGLCFKETPLAAGKGEEEFERNKPWLTEAVKVIQVRWPRPRLLKVLLVQRDLKTYVCGFLSSIFF